MGNWRTVNLIGKMSPDDAKNMINFLSSGESWNTPSECFNMAKSICGLNIWVNKDGIIDACGNLAERDYDNTDIENGLKFLVDKYPSIELVLHSGSDWESPICSATFHVKDGLVTKSEPEIKELPPIRMRSIFDFL